MHRLGHWERILVGWGLMLAVVLASLQIQAPPEVAGAKLPDTGSLVFSSAAYTLDMAQGQHAEINQVRPPRAAVIVNPEVVYYHHDATGNLAAMTDTSGQVVWHAEMRPFGQGTASPPDRPLRFLGQPQEEDISAEDGLYRLGARFFDPLTGSFLSSDPLPLTQIELGEPQRFNRYAYGLNNPYRYSDASGKDPSDGYEGTKGMAMKLGEIVYGESVLSTIRRQNSNITDVSKVYHVDPALVKSIIYEEQTHLIPVAESYLAEWLWMGTTVGLGQITVDYYGLDRTSLLLDVVNIHAIAKHLATIQSSLNFTPDIAYWATLYNCWNCLNTTNYGRRVQNFYETIFAP